jgi:hypothetical protein
MCTTSIDPQHPGKPTEVYELSTCLNAVRFDGMLICSSLISIIAFRNRKKNLRTSEVEM